MSGTRTIEVPAGLDSMSADELALLDRMRDDDGTPEQEARAPEAREVPEAAPEIEIPDDEPAVVTERHRKTAKDRIAELVEQRKATEKQLEAERSARAAEREAMARLESRFEVINQVMEAAARQAPAAAQESAPQLPDLPDKNTDPIGYFEALIARQNAEAARNAAKLQETIESQGALLKGFQDGQARAQQAAELRAWGMSQETAFAAREPSYRDAMTFLTQNRNDELEALGIADPAERDKIIREDITRIAAAARQQNANFAERLYNAALKRGFANKTARPALSSLEEAPATVAVDRTARAIEGRDNATTIGSLGSAPPPRLSVAKIADMPDKEFEALVMKLKATNPAAFLDLMGA